MEHIAFLIFIFIAIGLMVLFDSPRDAMLKRISIRQKENWKNQ